MCLIKNFIQSKELSKFKKRKNSITSLQKMWKDSSPKKIYRYQISTWKDVNIFSNQGKEI